MTATEPGPESGDPFHRLRAEMQAVPSAEPQFKAQSQYRLVGDIAEVWRDYSGRGVAVAVVDDGVEATHWDLRANYDAGRHVSVGGRALAPLTGSSEGHGTAVAGIIAAAANGRGTVGVAHEASVTGVDVLSDDSRANSGSGFLAALDQLGRFDVANLSWNYGADFSDDLNPAGWTVTAGVVARYARAAENGRGGLGTVIVQSAGNQDGDANGTGINASRHNVVVAAAGNDGYSSVWNASSGSNGGACVLVTAPGGGNGLADPLTTDMTGRRGFAAGDQTGFAGTSAAAPVVSGVVALMLDAGPGLGWRDVKDILAYSATVTGSGFSRSAGRSEDGDWIVTGGKGWNNGGAHFSTDYGYGMVDAHAAVRMAEAWHLFGAAGTSRTEAATSASRRLDIAIPDQGKAVSKLAVKPGIEIETVAVTLGLSHSALGDVSAVLVAPDGTRLGIGDLGSSGGLGGGSFSWTFGVEAFRGTSSGGSWTVEVHDRVGVDSGRLKSVRLDIHGADETAADIHHFTDEFFAMKALPGAKARGTLSDSDGGADWIDMSALTAPARVDLAPGATTSIGGKTAFRIAAGSVIENVVTGDGDDTVRGGSASNRLHGMRGDDRLSGGGGSDRLDGGTGRDVLAGGLGRDRLFGGAGEDVFAFHSPAEAGLASARDTLADFTRGLDRIDLRAIDADRGRDGNQAFDFIGVRAFGDASAGDLRFAKGAVSGDLDGDGRADFEIGVVASALSASDFLL